MDLNTNDEGTFAKQVLGEVGRVAKAIDDYRNGSDSRITALEKALANGLNPNRPGSGLPFAGVTLGDLVVKSEAFKSVLGNLKPGDTIPNFGTVKTALAEGILKAITTNATAVPDRTRLPNIVGDEPNWTNFLFNRFAKGTMVGGVLEYVQDTTPAWDSTVPPQTEGQPKPEVTSTFALKQVTPKTIAHWMAASKQILADAAALGGYLSNQLIQGLLLKAEYQFIMGTGVGENVLGVYTSAADHGAPEAGDSALDTIRKAIAVVESRGWFVDTIGLHPVDWAVIQCIKATDSGVYLYGSPSQSGTGASPMWGKTVVPSFIVPQGKFIVGPFASAAQLFEREGANVQAGFQNDDFTRNLVTLLAETRMALANYTPAAFRKGTL